MSRKILLLLIVAVLLVTTSCVRDFGEKHGNGEQPTIPFDFNWKTTKDLSLTVNMPSVVGVEADYVVVRVFSTPILLPENIVAQGVVKKSRAFNTAVTLPASVEYIYVQLTLPDGTKVVRSLAANSSQLALDGVVIKGQKSTKLLAETNAAAKSSMPDYPKFETPSPSDFDDIATFATTPSSPRELGGGWSGGVSYPARDAYYIPAGAVVNGNITFEGSNRYPILYVAGTFNIKSVNIGNSCLVVLPGGKVDVTGRMTARNSGNTEDKPTIYIFDGGTINLGSANLSCRCVVNAGVFNIEDLLDINTSCDFYNTSTAKLLADELLFSNKGLLNNDGQITIDEMSANGSHDITNYENSNLIIEECTIESGVSLVLKGKSKIQTMMLRGELYVNCLTDIDLFKSENAKTYIASDVALEVATAKLNNSFVYLAPSSLFIATDYQTGWGNKIVNEEKKDDDLTAVVKFTKAKAQGTDFQGQLEVVYDFSDLSSEYRLSEKKFKQGATLVSEQTVNIPKSDCNGGKGSITPEPEPIPEYYDKEGALYTYCFEDNWPWFGDYDMNDMVVAIRLNARVRLADNKVESITLKWETKASGAANVSAFAVQLDKIHTTNVASVVSSHNLGSGVMVVENGLERDNELAVLPLFNRIQEVFDLADNSTFINTISDEQPTATKPQTTTITFVTPVELSDVLESTLNPFLVINSIDNNPFERTREVHLPNYKPTKHAIYNIYNTVLPNSPYKYYAMGGDLKDNGMMWGLVIPGEFRYPAEMNDIRKTYKDFMPWASSGSAINVDWYNGDVDEGMLYK